MTREHNAGAADVIDYEGEARKEELRRFVREKWRRIRELERQGSPSNSSVSSEQELGPSKAKRDGDYRKAAVEYDPDNPLDEQRIDTKRAGVSEYKKVVLKPQQETISKKTGESSKAIGRPLLRPVSLETEPFSASASPQNRVRNAKPPRKSMGEQKADMGNRSESPSSVELTVAEVKNARGTRRSIALKAGKISLDDDVVNVIDQVDRLAISAVEVQSRQTDPHASADDDTPTRRRKRRSEVAHYQPSVSPLSLSIETSNALAELEANLARLKAHNSRSLLSKGEKRRTSEVKSHVQDESGREMRIVRRSLSPSKELRRLEQMHEEEELGRKVSFLTRVNEAKHEADVQNSRRGHETSTRDPSRREQSEEMPQIRDGVVKRKTRSNVTISQKQALIVKGDEPNCSRVKHDGKPLSQQRQDVDRPNTFLKGLRVLVDVRDKDGENASLEWINKLRSMGAKAYIKIPDTSSSTDTASGKGKVFKNFTHIIFKNGRPATTQYLRSLFTSADQEAPIVVGINWILQCLQEGKKVDERDFLVEIGKQAIFNKARTSLTPKEVPVAGAKGSHQQSLAELLARKKTIQRAPAQPSPLARRCWNLNASTSSSVSTATNQ